MIKIQTFDYKAAAKELDMYAKGFKIARTYSYNLGLLYLEKPKSRPIIEIVYRAWHWRRQMDNLREESKTATSAVQRLGITMRAFGLRLNRPWKGLIDSAS